MKLNILAAATLLAVSISSFGQEKMTLSQAIHTARSQSVKALEARQSFISTYWAYRSYQASRLPSVYMYGNLMREVLYSLLSSNKVFLIFSTLCCKVFEILYIFAIQ